MEELSYQKVVSQNYKAQKISYIVTCISSGGIPLIFVLVFGLLYILVGNSFENARKHEMTGLLELFGGTLGYIFITSMAIFIFGIGLLLILDLIIESVVFFKCRKIAKKYMEDSKNIRQYRIWMGIFYAILFPKILCLICLLYLQINFIILAMLVFYCAVVVIGIRNTFSNRIVEKNQYNSLGR